MSHIFKYFENYFSWEHIGVGEKFDGTILYIFEKCILKMDVKIDGRTRTTGEHIEKIVIEIKFTTP